MPTVLSAEVIAEAQQRDTELPELLTSHLLDLHLHNIEGHQLACNILGRTVRPYLPQELRRTAFDIIHGFAHPSIRATVRAVADKFVWPGIRKEVSRWAQVCEACQRAKVQRHNRAALDSFQEPDGRFEHVHLDIIVMPQVGALRYCLTIIDRFTRWPVAIPLTDIKAETIAKAFFSGWITDRSCPLTITTDQGTQFESALFTAFAQMLGAKRTRTTPYHPQSNGMVERMHRTLKAALMCAPFVPWPDALPTILFGLRHCFKEDLQASPWEMVYGTTPRLPGDFFVGTSALADPTSFVGKLRELLSALRPVPAAHHSKLRPFTIPGLDTCTHVFQRDDTVRKPLAPPYAGPFKVVRRVSPKVYVILVNGAEKTVTTDALKPAHRETADDQAVPRPPTATPPVAPPTVADRPASLPQADPPTSPATPSLSPPHPHQQPLPPPPQAHNEQPNESGSSLGPPCATAPLTRSQTSTLPPPPKRTRHVPAILRRRVTFRSPPANVTGGGVPVAASTRGAT